MAPQPAKVVVVVGLLAACAGTAPRGGFAIRPEQADAERRCQAGSTPACGALGRMLIERDDNRKDVERGLVVLEIACGQDDWPSCALLARTYLRRSGNAKAVARAHDLVARACERRSAPACTQLGEAIRAESGADDAQVEAFYKGCDLGDAEGCELYALAQLDKAPTEGRLGADAAFGHACELGRISSCHYLGMMRLRHPEARAEAALLLIRSCQRGYTQSCGQVGMLLAPLVSANADCARAAPLAARACETGDHTACAISDACKLAIPAEAGPALERLRAACDQGQPFACLYWADAESARTQPPPDLDRVAFAYGGACRLGRGPVDGVACPRLFALQLDRAKNMAEAEPQLSKLWQYCDRSSGEACCALSEQHRIGKWIPADADKARQLRGKACGLGCERCCR